MVKLIKQNSASIDTIKNNGVRSVDEAEGLFIRSYLSGSENYVVMIVNINIVNDGEEGVVCFSCGCC